MRQKPIKLVPLASSIALALLFQAIPAQAEQVQMFDQPPSAEEMGKLLFGGKSAEPAAAPGGIKMRSIGFKKAAPAPTTESVTENAKADLASVGLPIKFAYNSDEILPESIPFLEEVGKMLSMDDFSDKRIVIEGHTDAAGNPDYNRALSQRRANAVSHFLSSNFNIPHARLKALGLGESKPLPGHDPQDEANRRVQFYSAN